MGVTIPFPISEVKEEQEQPSLTYRIDFEKKRIIGRVDGIEAVKQAIHKVLITPRFRCLAYDNQYGSELKESICSKDASREYIEAEIPRLVKDALLPDTRILRVYDFSFNFIDDNVYIKFKANTIFGETFIEEEF